MKKIKIIKFVESELLGYDKERFEIQVDCPNKNLIRIMVVYKITSPTPVLWGEYKSREDFLKGLYELKKWLNKCYN